MSTATRTPSAPRDRLPSPVRDRRPALAALALLLVLGGAFASALIAYRTGDRVDVLVAGRSIGVGEQVQPQDFRVARVAAEGADTVPAALLNQYVGTRATGAIPEGALITNRMFIASGVVPADGAVVGVVLGISQRPAEPLGRGDVVQVFAVPRDAGSVAAQATPLLPAARVLEVGASDSGGGQKVSLLVRSGDVTKLVGASSASLVSVARLAPGTKPIIDLSVGEP